MLAFRSHFVGFIARVLSANCCRFRTTSPQYSSCIRDKALSSVKVM